MPERGLAGVLHRGRTATSVLGDWTEHGPLLLPDALLLQVTFEIDRPAALAAIPAQLTCPIPAYGRLMVLDTGVDPGQAGFCGMAAVLIGARHALGPRNVVAGMMGDTCCCPASLPWRLGMDPAKGMVGASLSLPSTGWWAPGSGCGARFTLDGLRPIEPSLLRWDPWVFPLREDWNRPEPALVEWPVSVVATEAFVTHEAALELQKDWAPFSSRGIISACAVRGAVTFGPPVMHEA